VLADYADVLAMAQNRSLQGEPEKLVARALQLDPKNIKALALYGAAAFERHDYALAVTRWKTVLPLVPADSETARALKSSIDEAQKLAAAPAATSDSANATSNEAAPTTASASEAQVSGKVELDPALRSQVTDDATVFIFARAAGDSAGPRFPLAVLRKQVKDLPATFTLDDSMSMMAGAKLSNFPTVVVGARISKSGSATPGAGDLEGLSEPIHPGAKGVLIRIASVRK
jgi:cytochrome c-type biogenesis protein CcmH